MRRVPQSQSTSDFPRNRRKRIACRQCRQAKIRCELSTEGSIPCSRCRRLGHDCRLDTTFQRVNRRERLEELEKELQQLQSSISNLPPASRPLQNVPAPNDLSYERSSFVENRPSQVTEDSFLPELPSVPLLERSIPSPPARAGLQPTLLDAQNPLASPRALDFLQFSGRQIENHFHIFFEKYHPHAPILDSAIPPDEYFSRSPLLFWVIILISSRRHPDEPGLFVSLTAPVKKLLWDTIANPPHTWYLIQSILLLCLWPLPTSSLSTDNTSVLVATSQTIAIRLGLHRPEAIQDFSRTRRRLSPGEVAEAARTWATCYIAAQTLATTDGQAWASPDWMIDRLCDRDDVELIPMSLKHQLLISRFSGRVCRLMSELPHSPTAIPRPGDSMSILARLEQEYLDTCSTISSQLTDENQALLSGAGLQLYVFYLLENNESDARRKALFRAFSTATDLIFQLKRLASSSELPEHGPVTYFRVISLAAMFILKLFYSNLGVFLDIDSGKRAYNFAIYLTRRISIEDNDLPGRMSKILTQLWSAQMRSSLPTAMPTLKLKTRMAASLIHDSLWIWREEFGGQRSGEHTPPVGVRTPNPSLQDYTVGNTQDESTTDGWSLEDMVDAEMLALLPFSLDGGDASVEPRQ
ncbi:hypothetical protein BDV59DRAFT_176132 [Aspergillus ambiguus]|uniref:Zn(II)2Cys6 transcription factor n=1 Tax=Aspergillus ambiguus TaxID=176160 RepID=UPI003CCD7DA9